MKTYEIKDLLKKDLLIIEAKNESIAWAMIFNEWGSKAVADYTLLGTPDEIKEDDVVDLCDRIGINNPLADCDFFAHYGNDETMFETALESFHSALESEIYWSNPLGEKPQFKYDFPPDGPSEFMYESAVDDFDTSSIAWHETQKKTFDKKRTLIFVKN